MRLKTFKAQPDERSEFQESVRNFFKKSSLKVHDINGLFDLLIESPTVGTDSYLELKVRLASQHSKCAISRLQWHFFRTRSATSFFAENFRVLIYDHERRMFALATTADLASGLTMSTPRSTSYISKACLDKLDWRNPTVASTLLLNWVRRSTKRKKSSIRS